MKSRKTLANLAATLLMIVALQVCAFPQCPDALPEGRGDSCAILLARNTLAGFGHMAIIIRDDDGEWRLWSKNGDNKGNLKTFFGKTLGAPDDSPLLDNSTRERKGFPSVQAFLDDTIYNSCRHDGTGFPYYTEAIVLPTTREQNLRAAEIMVVKINQRYDFFSNNCSHAVIKALKTAGLTLKSAGRCPQRVGCGTIPVVVFKRIRKIYPASEVLTPHPS